MAQRIPHSAVQLLQTLTDQQWPSGSCQYVHHKAYDYTNDLYQAEQSFAYNYIYGCTVCTCSADPRFATSCCGNYIGTVCIRMFCHTCCIKALMYGVIGILEEAARCASMNSGILHDVFAAFWESC